MKVIKVVRANDNKHKYMAVIDDNSKQRLVRFGSYGMSDYTIHKDDERKQRYIARHQAREDWSKSGRLTPGFWAKHYLWTYTSKDKALEEIRRKYFD